MEMGANKAMNLGMEHSLVTGRLGELARRTATLPCRGHVWFGRDLALDRTLVIPSFLRLV